MTPHVKDEHIGSFSYMKEAHMKENGEERMEDVGVWPNGHAFWVFSCPKSQKHFSPKMGFPQIQIYFPYSSIPMQ